MCGLDIKKAYEEVKGQRVFVFLIYISQSFKVSQRFVKKE